MRRSEDEPKRRRPVDELASAPPVFVAMLVAAHLQMLTRAPEYASLPPGPREALAAALAEAERVIAEA